MRKSLTGVCAVFAAAIFMLISLTSCGDSHVSTAADGLNLHAVASLISQAHDGEHFEAVLNQPSINNLDLDGDGQLDYINVTEYGEGLFRGYSLTVHMPDGSVQQVAEITFQHNSLAGHVTFQIHGNPQIYGANYYVRSAQPLSLSQAIFLQWAFTPRVIYVSPYSRTYLPSTYVRVRTVPVTTYRTVTTPTVKNSGVKLQETKKAVITPTVQSPNAGKASAAIVAPLKQPTATQKQFQERPETKQIQKATGFAKSPVRPETKTLTPTLPKKETPPAVLPTDKTKTQKEFMERDNKKPIAPATGFGAPKTTTKTPPPPAAITRPSSPPPSPARVPAPSAPKSGKK